MTTMKKMLVIAILAAGGAAAVFLLRDGSGKAAAGIAAAPAEVVAPGTVESESQRLDLSFEQAGRVVAVAVTEGERVSEGQVLARLDDRLARARVARAEAALASAVARRDLAFRGARSEEIRAAKAEAEAAEATAHERQMSGTRATRLLDQAAVSAAEADAAQAAAKAANGQASAAAARLAVLERGTRSEEKREAMAAVAAAQADLDEARTLLSQTELTAPCAGTVLRRFVEPGEQVAMVPPTIAISIADLDHVQLRAEVDETDIARVAPGAKAYATAEAFGTARVPGRIVRAMQELGRKKVVTDDPRARIDTRVLEVIFVPDAGHAALPLGLRMDVHIDPSAAAIASTRQPF
jgi:HlyD family secretion protein